MNKKIIFTIVAIVVLLLLVMFCFRLCHNENSASEDSVDVTSNTGETSEESPDASLPAEDSVNTSTEVSNVINEETSSDDTSENWSGGVVIGGNDNLTSSDDTFSEPDEEVSEEVSIPVIKDPDISMTYEEYLSLSSAEQQAHYESFASVEDFFAWYNNAKSLYDEENKPIEISGTIDFSDILNGD